VTASAPLLAVAPAADARARRRRPVYLGEGLTYELRHGAAVLATEAIDLTSEGLGLAVVGAPVALPGLGDVVSLRYSGPGASGTCQDAIVRHTGALRSGRRVLPRIGLELVSEPAPAAGHASPDALPAFAAAGCPWFLTEHLRFRVRAVDPGGMTLEGLDPAVPLIAGAELDFALHLPLVGVEPARARLTCVGRDAVRAEWVEPPRGLLRAISRYLLTADATLTPTGLRAGGLAVGGIEQAFTFDCASSSEDFDAILALRLLAHQAEGHLNDATVEDMRSPYDAHSRHLTCRFGGRIVGYVRAIFVDGDPARSQYVSMGGHVVPQWLWDAGFLEGGAGAVHPDFQRGGLYVPLMQHLWRVTVQTGHRYMLGACPDELVAMYEDMGFHVMETRDVRPKPGWSFRSHLIYGDAEEIVREASRSRGRAAMAAAIEFARS
jgi:GNAT superfamily N-acetyltransferase